MSKSGNQALLPLVISCLSLCAFEALAQVWPAARGDGQLPGDVDVWSEWRRSSPPAAASGLVSDESFAAIAQGGPWSESEWLPMSPGLAGLFARARSGRWADVIASMGADDAEPNARDRDGATLLTLACRQGQADAVRELLRRGADPDQQGAAGLTPLGAAAMGGHDLVVQALLRAGADVGRRSAHGQPPLHLAARGGHVKVLRSLLAARADALAWNREGRGALHEAASTGSIEAMAVLAAAGVPVSATDRQGLNALHAAALGRHLDAMAWLQQRGVSAPHPLTQVLLERPADPLPPQP